jgi:hypothetical protein
MEATLISRATCFSRLFFVLSFLSFPAWAQRSCSKEVLKFCPGAEGIKVLGCLMQNSDSLSVECKQEVQRRMEQTKGGLGAFSGVMGSFGILPSGKTLINYNGNFAGINQQKIAISTPVWSHRDESLSMSANAGSIAFDETNTFRRSTIRTPKELQRVELGAQYTRKLAGQRSLGFRTSIGSASDKVLYGANEMIFSLNASYSKPGKGDNHWIYTVFLSNNNPLANYVPIPGFIYLYKKQNFTGMFGLPFLSMQWTPVKPVVLSMSYFITNLNTEAAYGFNDHVQLFSGFSISQQMFLRKDRTELQQRLFYNEKRVFIGLRSPLSKILSGDVQFGNSFDRKLEEGRRFNNTKLKSNFGSSTFVSANINLLF